MLKKLLKTGNHSAGTSFALLLFRAGVGVMMLTHGYPKFKKVLSGDMGFGDPIGLGSDASLVLTVLAEFICSILLVLGLTTRFALVPLIITMFVALVIVHGGDPFGTQEKSALYLLCFVVLFITGPGKYSVDNRFFG